MEAEYAKLKKASGIRTYKFRGDTHVDFMKSEWDADSFPTIIYMPSKGTMVKYDSDDRSVEAMAAFAKRLASATNPSISVHSSR